MSASDDSAAGSDWLKVELDPAVEAALGIPVPPVPVRSERRQAVLGREGMGDRPDLGALLEEIEAFVEAEPEAAEAYGPLATTIAYVHGLERGQAGDHAAAAQALRSGLTFDPGNLALASNLAVALAGMGEDEAAIEVGQAIAGQPGVAPQAPLWMLTAKLLRTAGRPADAVDLLDELADTAPGDPTVWELRDACLEDAGRTA